MRRRAADLRVGDEIERRRLNRRARLEAIEVLTEVTDSRIAGVWMTWSDGLGPYVADPDYAFELAPGVVERDDYGG